MRAANGEHIDAPGARIADGNRAPRRCMERSEKAALPNKNRRQSQRVAFFFLTKSKESSISVPVAGELAERLGRGLQILLQRFESVTRLFDGKLAERLGRGLQILLQRFESVTCL